MSAATKQMLRERIAAQRVDEPSDRETIEVPSRTGRHVHSVNLRAHKCTCSDFYFRKAFCYHMRVARWSVWLNISVAEVLANLLRGKERFGCKAGAGCSFCASGSAAHPSRDSYLHELEMSVSRDIAA
jgi:hypothetical protein